MSNAGYIYVRNWEQRQHHKYESPPWHKVYNNTLRDDDYLHLSHADRGLLHDLWTLASLSGDGRVSADPRFLARQLNVRRVQLDSLVAAGFITIHSGRSTASRQHLKRPKRGVDMPPSVHRDPLEIQPNTPRDSSGSHKEAGLEGESATDRIRDESESVSTEIEKSREEKTHVNGPQKKGTARSRVWAAYEAHHPDAKLTQDRKRLIDTRLSQGFTEAQLVDAIEGNHRDPYCSGENQAGKKYHALDLILRNADKIEQYANVPKPKPAANGTHADRVLVPIEHIRTEELIKRGIPTP